ncbi:GntR family transcriptional regulator [Alkalibacillus aidingensis]|uniref:GntR family transcriptional regulator n=1 Tax=Alkalibacillus aidingensis TaxID=2747607 RepID=UPI001660C286|nr:GntR family transcriptional regulator [Alkalibacillus aidingensis]
MKLPIKLSKQSREPFYHQIEQQIKALIASGQLLAGDSLPSIRSLSNDLEVSVITTRRAYQNLEYQELIHTSQGKGTFVSDVHQSLKDEVQKDMVYQAVKQAIQTAKQHNYTEEEIRDTFLEALSKEENL